MMDIMKMIGAFTNCLESVTKRFESLNTRTQSYMDITPNAHDVQVKKVTHASALQHVHALILPMLCDYVWLCACWLFELSTGCLFVFALNVFTLLAFIIFFSSKIQKHIKNRKSKSLINFVEFCLKACFALYFCTNGLVHLQEQLVPYALISLWENS